MTYSSGTHRHCCPADTQSVDTSTRLASWIDLFWKCSPNGSIGILLSSSLCMLPGLVYNACQLEVAGIYKTRALILDISTYEYVRVTMTLNLRSWPLVFSGSDQLSPRVVSVFDTFTRLTGASGTVGREASTSW